MARMSLKVLPPLKWKPVGKEPPAFVQLSEPMLRFKCNQKGCCCSGWDISFDADDFVRLHDQLDAEDRAVLTRNVKFTVEEKSDGATTLRSVQLAGMGDSGACRFLATDGGCGVQRRYGTDALPNLCADFPAFGYRQDDGRVELWFDPVCPEVLEQLDESDEPMRLVRQRGFFGDGGLDLRVSHAAEPVDGRLAGSRLERDAVDRVRAASVEAFADPARPVWRTLAAVAHAFQRLQPGGEADFRVVEPGDIRPFLRFLKDCACAHASELLAASVLEYRRFIWSIDAAPLARSPELAGHLENWEPAFERWLVPEAEALRPLASRWLAHRFGLPMIASHGELRESADAIVRIYGTSLRLAAAMGALLERPVDRDVYKAAIGAAEYFNRGLELPRDALPWFAAAGTG